MFIEQTYTLYINHLPIKNKFFTINHAIRWLRRHPEYIGDDIFFILNGKKFDISEKKYD